jgi:antitoxin (DNA-binding transcriptional repressor) of toxin-antitoxin stability system
MMKLGKKKAALGQKQRVKSVPRLAAVRSAKTSRVVSATQAARSFSELLDRVCYRGESFVIERGGELVCEMSRVKPPHFTGADFLSLVRSLPKPDPRFWDTVKEATRQRRAVPESPWES